jgi:acyl-CoA dehydrogenase
MTMASVLRFNNLKLAASEHAPSVCGGALEVVGIVGYRNDTPYSVGRHLRDALSARLMVANERLHATDAALLLIAKEV